MHGLLVPSGKAYNTFPTDHLITGSPLWSESALEKVIQVKLSIRISILWLSLMVISVALAGCHDILV